MTVATDSDRLDPSEPSVASELPVRVPRRRSFWSRLRRNPTAMAGLAWIVLLLLMAAIPGFIASKSPTAQDFTYTHINEVPSAAYWLGTDQFGRDLFARVVWGSRYALESIAIGLGIATVVGIPIGMIAGWRGGRFDRAVVWVIDVLFSLPLILVAMAIVAATGQGIVPAMSVVGFLTSTRFARMARGVTLGEREQLYVDSARITGLSTSTILRRYILPNLLPDLMVGFAIVAGAVLLTSAVLSFLGAGAPYDSYDWGAMLNLSQPLFLKDPWGVVPPSAMIVLTVLAFNLLGDGIRDAIGRDASHNAMTRSKRKVDASSVSPHADDAILSIRDLSVVFPEPGRRFEQADQVLDGVSLDVRPGETLGIVGESGSGKSMTVLSALGLVPAPGVVTQGSVRFDGRDVTDLPERDWQHIRGKEIGVIFQEPIAVLNPALTIGAHLCEPLRLHFELNRKEAWERAAELLRRVRVPDPIRRLDEYPHQMSGGMAQRVGIAMALACEPKLLIADEPTTALDVTVQGQILDLLASLTDEAGMAMIIITHDMGVVAEVADRVAVMYGGQVVEVGSSDDIFGRPRHPYTAALLDTMPQNNEGAEYLRVIPGMVPSSSNWPSGCRFHPRCSHASSECTVGPPQLLSIGRNRLSRCIKSEELDEDVHLASVEEGVR